MDLALFGRMLADKRAKNQDAAHNPDHPEAYRDLSHPYELHRTIKRLVGEDTPLWRLEGCQVLLQSAVPPHRAALPSDYYQDQPQQRPFPIERLQIEGRTLRFRLRANPTVSQRTQAFNGKAHRGKRMSIFDQTGQQEWLHRQATKAGFTILSAEIGESGKIRFHKRPGTPEITVYACLFDGLLKVDNPNLFRQALRQGLGPAKAFGMGLLSVGVSD